MSKDKYEDYDYDYDNDLDYDDNNINFEITTNNTTVITNTIVNTTTVVDTVIINQNKTKNYIYGTRRKDYLMAARARGIAKRGDLSKFFWILMGPRWRSKPDGLARGAHGTARIWPRGVGQRPE